MQFYSQPVQSYCTITCPEQASWSQWSRMPAGKVPCSAGDASAAGASAGCEAPAAVASDHGRKCVNSGLRLFTNVTTGSCSALSSRSDRSPAPPSPPYACSNFTLHLSRFLFLLNVPFAVRHHESAGFTLGSCGQDLSNRSQLTLRVSSMWESTLPHLPAAASKTSCGLRRVR